MRRLGNNEVKEVEEIIQLAPKSKLVRDHIMKKFSKQVTLKDIQNICTKLKTNTKHGRSDAQVLLDHLEEELEKDKGAKGGIIVNENDQLSIVYYCSSHLLQLYEKFPEVIMIDGTYNVNKCGMPLYSFMVEDGYGCGQTVFYAATTEESSQHLSLLSRPLKRVIHAIQRLRLL